MSWLRTALVCLLLAIVPAAWAVNPDEMLADPALEQRARDISGELRCLVCQNESVDDSDADLAKDIRVLVRERLTAGDTDDQVRQFLVDRYGEFVLLRPRIEGHTLLLWFAAPGLLVIGLIVIAIMALRRRKPVTVNALSAIEQAAIDSLADK